MRQDAEYLESIGLQREAVANVEQIRGIVSELNTANATIAAQAKQIERLKEALGNSQIALTFYREHMTTKKYGKIRYPFGAEAEENARALLAELSK